MQSPSLTCQCSLTVALLLRRQSSQSLDISTILLLDCCAEASSTTVVALDGLGNNIEDAEFFPDLPGLVREVADRLTRLMDLDRRLISALHKASHLLNVVRCKS